MLLLSFALLIQTPVWTARPEGRTADTVSFEQINDATIDSKGERLYVLDNRLRQVRVFALSGHQIGSFGRRGQGPGEFEHPSRLGWQADTLWLMEGAYRVHRFSPSGRFYRTNTARDVHAVSADGGLLLQLRGSGLPGTPAATRNSLEIAHLNAGKLRTVVRLEQEQVVKPIQLKTEGGYLWWVQPFRDDVAWAFGREARQLYLVDRQVSSSRTATFGVMAISLTGDTLWSRRYPYQPRPLTQRMVDDRINTIRAEARSIPPPTPVVLEPGAWAKEVYRPSHLPPVEGIVVGRDGTIWLKRETIPGSRTGTHVVLSPTGEPIGIVRLPSAERLIEADGHRVWTIAKDADEIPYVAWYRVTR